MLVFNFLLDFQQINTYEIKRDEKRENDALSSRYEIIIVARL